MRTVALLLLTGACGFRIGSGVAIDAGPDDMGNPPFDLLDPDAAVDAPQDASMFGDIDFLPPPEEFAATGNWTISTDTTINTSNLAATTTPANTQLVLGLQDDGSMVAILRVKDLKVESGDALRVIGSVPLVIIADHDVNIDGTLDLGARTVTPGAGGFSPFGGPGVGGHGASGGNNEDSGGGGGGFGTAGAVGGTGNNVVAGGTAGQPYAANRIVGGSTGGGPPQLAGCTNRGGAGGGAVLIYARGKIDVKGTINAGGGGGEPGMDCSGNFRSGAGGGAGGLIYLQTPELRGDGDLVANGGGGGGGSCVNSNGGVTVPTSGNDGGLTVALGGLGRGDCGANGGSGAIQGTVATSGSPVRSNGGGGGGGLGRIIYRAPSLPGNLGSSPTAVPAPP